MTTIYSVRPDLLGKLLTGNTPDLELFPLEEAAAVLSCTPGGEPVQSVAERAESLLRNWGKPEVGLIKLSESGQTKTVPGMPLFFTRSAGLITTPSVAYPVLQVSIEDLLKVRGLLKAESCWSGLADVLTGFVDVAVAEDQGDRTHVPLQTFILRSDGKYKGSTLIDSHHRNRPRGSGPYVKAFNSDGTVNEPEFIRIAKIRSEWDDGAINLSRAMGAVISRQGPRSA